MEHRTIPKWITSALSVEQQKPLNRLTANACVLAAAGSGKTRTLVHLLANDLANDTPAKDIIAFTFTEKAAEELLARIHLLAKKHLPNIDLGGMYVGTIHAWCLQYLTEQQDFYNFTPIDELHVDALVSRLYDVLGLEKAYGQPYPRAIGKFLKDIEVFFNEDLVLEQVPNEIRSSIETFLNVLYSNRLITFGGMIRYATEHLRENSSVVGLKALYVDEYQDVNPAQVSLIKAMLPDEAKIIGVGDDLQCIYNWRGSDVTRILNFSDEFNEVSIHRLSTNYRSRPSLVSLGNACAENITLRDEKKVMSAAREGVGPEVIHWLTLDSEEKQANVVADIVEKFAAEGVPWNKMVILLRSVVGAGKPLVDALIQRGIPVQCPILSRGGEFINGFLLPIFEWLRAEHDEPRNQIEEEAANQAADKLWITVSEWIGVPNGENVFWDALNDWLDQIEDQHNYAYNVRSWLYDFLDKCGIHVAPNDPNLMVGLGIASQIIRSVEEIHRHRLEGQQRRTPRGIMSEVYFALKRNQHAFGESIPIDAEEDAVLITTIHQAKGLEWPIVILPMLVNNRFPLRSQGHNTSFPDELVDRYGTSLEDERRLFYVAITRAKERLFLLDPVRQRRHRQSTFLRELQGKRVLDVTTLEQISSQVWKLNPEDLEDDDPAPLRIGISDLLLYIECPYQFGLRRSVTIQPSVGDELGFGKGLHELIQRQLETEDQWTPDELRRQVSTHVNLPYMSESGEFQSQQAILNRVQALGKLGVLNNVVDTEMHVEVLFDGGIVHGIVDSIQDERTGVIVRDWKSNIHDSFVPRYERQIQFYVYALQLNGLIVSQADIVDVASSAEQNTLITREVAINENALTKLVYELGQALKGITERNFSAKPSPASCTCCDMYKICSERYADEKTQSDQ